MFKEYPSLENHYQSATVAKWVERFPELKDCNYIIFEKLDGANFCAVITKDNIQFQRRSALLKENENFFGYQEVIKRYMDDFSKIQKALGKDDTIIHLYCELIGSKVLNRVKYFDNLLHKELRVIDMFVNGNKKTFLEQKALLEVVCGLTGGNSVDKLNTAPFVGVAKGIEEAMNFNHIFDSKVLLQSDNVCEGIVIQPMNKVYKWSEDQDSYFIIKKKNEKFHEQKHQNKEFKLPEPNQLLSYVNESRILSLFSKISKIEESKQIGQYIKAIQDDIRVDAIKDGYDNSVIELDLKKLGTVIAIELKKYL